MPSEAVIVAPAPGAGSLRFDLADTCAKLRSDLEMRAESSDPHAPVIVKDPVTHRYYRFTWVQAAVLRGLDGRRDAATLAAAATAECDEKVQQSQVEDFVARLEGLLLLDNALCGSRLEKLSRRRHRILDSLLAIKIWAVNPDRLLARLEKDFGRIFFGPGFQAVAWTSIFAGVILSIVNWEELYFSWPRLFNLYSIPLILAVGFAVMSLHELAHGLTLKHFGGKVEEMGLLFLYFIPALYCNVSDAWLLRKRERMLVTFAGGFLQLVLWSWAVILWRLMAPETIGSRICLITIAFSGILTLFNFNPLIRLDGYYLLSDYLEIPNLRQKAFRYLKGAFDVRTLLGRRAAASSGRRETRIFAVYGFSAFLFSAGLLWIVLSRVGSWMVTRYQTWGILLFSALCILMLPVGGNKDEQAPVHKHKSGVEIRIKKFPYFFLVVLLLVAAGFLPWELKVSGEFTILPNSEVTINPQVSGTLQTIYVDEGDLVQKGEVLAEIQNLELSNAYEETRGELASSQAKLRLLQAGVRPEEIALAQKVVATRQTELKNVPREQERKRLKDTEAKRNAELQNARINYERSKALLSQGLIARSEFDRDETAYQVSQKQLAEATGELKVLEEQIERDRQLKTKELEQAQSQLNILLAGSRKEEIQAMEALVVKLQDKLQSLGLQLEQLKVRSLIVGQVATPYLKNKIGEYIDKGSLFCRIVDVTKVNVDMPVPEKEIADVALGYRIVLRVRTFPARQFEARVVSISPVAIKGSQVIRGELANQDGALKAGMTGVGKVMCGKRMILNLVTRRFIRWLRTEFWEYLP